ncbi:MAG: bifunctional folylpolyglutamate synthase/dihydrofolate synthase [Muribaculaceae bacterium]|nr:bifunctional folylpolyglutamate synthase/dihydrofolate synthase [Muribaculaceae bacterium]
MWERTLDYLFNQRPAFERQGADGYKPGLETSLALDKLYKEPHRRFRIIHIAGTNGKGSTAHLLASCLQRCGYRVGLFTSPHLVDFRERIRVNGRKISRSYVMQWVSEYQKKDLGGLQPSFFELTSTMAFDYFAWRNVNVAVIETGLGGRLDSTNIVTPELSIITNIGLEHQQFLGNTLEEIASEKAGIIKHGQPVVIGRAEGVVRDVFEREAKRLYADIRFAQDRPEVLSAKHADGVLRIETVNYGTLDCELTGDYQIENTNTVLTALNMLKRLKYRIREKAVHEGFAHVIENTGLMGRWMRLGTHPLVICDSAHNPAGIEQVIKQLKHEDYKRLHMVMGFMADKDVKSILNLLPKDAVYYFTQAQTSRSMTVEQLQSLAAKCGIEGSIYNNVSEALDAARNQANDEDLIYVGGSMYVLAELLIALNYGDDLSDS